jgi:hypothetical protein
MRILQGFAALLMVALLALTLTPGTSARNMNYSAQLSAAEEVPSNASPATGQAVYTLSADGLTLHYKLTVTNITNPFMAHIHTGAKGVNGPVVLPLFNGPAASGVKNGTLIEGDATAAQLTGPMAGKTMADLLAEMDAGNTYSNIHTNDGKDPAGTGPGDLAAGEIRGQNVVTMPGLPSTGGGGMAQGFSPLLPVAVIGLSLAGVALLESRRRAERTR